MISELMVWIIGKAVIDPELNANPLLKLEFADLSNNEELLKFLCYQKLTLLSPAYQKIPASSFLL